LAQTHAAQQSNLERSRHTTAARYEAMAQAHAARPSGIQRGQDATAARYTGMAQSYRAMEVAGAR
jgi:hypothetical protein